MLRQEEDAEVMALTAPLRSAAVMALTGGGHAAQAGVEGGQVESLQVAGVRSGGQVDWVEASSSLARDVAWLRASRVAVAEAMSRTGAGERRLVSAREMLGGVQRVGGHGCPPRARPRHR